MMVIRSSFGMHFGEKKIANCMNTYDAHFSPFLGTVCFFCVYSGIYRRYDMIEVKFASRKMELKHFLLKLVIKQEICLASQ